jgi:hypothetical protein
MLRVDAPFPAIVRGRTACGKAFEAHTHLDSLSASDLRLCLAYPVEVGDRLFVLVRLSTAGTYLVSAPRVAVRGVVLRVESGGDGLRRVVIGFTCYRFVYAVKDG